MAIRDLFLVFYVLHQCAVTIIVHSRHQFVGISSSREDTKVSRVYEQSPALEVARADPQ